MEITENGVPLINVLLLQKPDNTTQHKQRIVSLAPSAAVPILLLQQNPDLDGANLVLLEQDQQHLRQRLDRRAKPPQPIGSADGPELYFFFLCFTTLYSPDLASPRPSGHRQNPESPCPR